ASTPSVAGEAVLGSGPREALATFEIERSGERLASRARPADEMDQVLARGLGVPALRVLTPPLDAYAAAREQWDDGCNVLALAPGKVVADERAAATNEDLRGQGEEGLEFAGDELGRGRGGPRCLSCPVARGGGGRSAGSGGADRPRSAAAGRTPGAAGADRAPGAAAGCRTPRGPCAP